MPVNQISALPDAPSRSNPSNFAAKADAFLGAFPTLRTEINAVITQMNDYATLASTSEGSGLTATSTTSLAIVSSGSVILTIASGKQFVAGQRIVIWNEAGNKGMAGRITSYSDTSLTVAVTDAIGSGTLASWSIFTIPTTMSLTSAPEGTEIFYPPSVSAVLELTATEERPGLIELATEAEVLAGTDTSKAITPATAQSLKTPLATEEEALAGTSTTKAMTPATTKAVVDAITPPITRENVIVDGNFDHWFEGTSQTTNGYGSDTMWYNGSSGSTKTHSRQTFALGDTDAWDAPAAYYSRTIVSSVAGAGNYCFKSQHIEDVRKPAGRKVTLSFRAKADAAKNIAVEFQQVFGTGGSPSASVTRIGSQLVALTTAWQKFEITVELPSISGKTLGTNGDHFTVLRFWFDAGSNWDARAASLGQQSGTFDIAQVKLEIGDYATPFVAPDPGEELARVERYYQEAGRGVAREIYIHGNIAFAYGIIGNSVALPVDMRAVPTATKVGTWEVSNTVQPNLTPTRKSLIVYADGLTQGNASISSGPTGYATLDARL